MNLKRNPSLTSNSQELRRNMTKEEKHLWYDFLKICGTVVKRQKVIGDYIVDFCIPSSNIVIELDGSQHYEPEAKEYDKRRDEYLTSLGYTVLRYTNLDINRNFAGVCRDITKHIDILTPHQSLRDSFPSEGKPKNS